MALIFSKTRSVCSSTVSPTIFPVAGSSGPCPETKIKSPTRNPCEYAPTGDAPDLVVICCLGISESPFILCHCEEWRGTRHDVAISSWLGLAHLPNLPGKPRAVPGVSPGRQSSPRNDILFPGFV